MSNNTSSIFRSAFVSDRHRCVGKNRRVPQVSLLRPGIRATDPEWKSRSLVCSSADLSWKCLSTAPGETERALRIRSNRTFTPKKQAGRTAKLSTGLT
jgi:hypothetical protein